MIKNNKPKPTPMPAVRVGAYEAIKAAGYRVWSRNTGASLAEVALVAGVGRATLHRHFKGRDDLMHALALDAVQDIERISDIAAKRALSYTGAMKKIFYALVEHGERHAFLMNGEAERFPDIATMIEAQNAEFMRVIGKAKGEGLCPASCPDTWVLHAYDVLIYGAWQMIINGEATPKQAAKLGWHMFESGLKKAKL